MSSVSDEFEDLLKEINEGPDLKTREEQMQRLTAVYNELTDELNELGNETAVARQSCSTLEMSLGKITKAVEQNLQSYKSTLSNIENDIEQLEQEYERKISYIDTIRKLLVRLTQSGINLSDDGELKFSTLMEICNLEHEDVTVTEIEPEVEDICNSHRYFYGCTTNDAFASRCSKLQKDIARMEYRIKTEQANSSRRKVYDELQQRYQDLRKQYTAANARISSDVTVLQESFEKSRLSNTPTHSPYMRPMTRNTPTQLTPLSNRTPNKQSSSTLRSPAYTPDSRNPTTPNRWTPTRK